MFHLNLFNEHYFDLLLMSQMTTYFFIFRIFWGLALVTSLIFMVYFLFINQNQSTIVEISEKLPIYQIPFPAVTICPETKAKKSIVNVTDAYHNIIYNLTEYQYDNE